MSRKLVSAMTLMFAVVGMLVVTIGVHGVKAGGTVYIRTDGSIDPDTAPISSADNVTYTLTDNINDNIVVERDYIVLDGKGYTVQGTGTGYGVSLTGRSNVTIKNMEVTGFFDGIFLWHCRNNTIYGNSIKGNNKCGINLYEDCDHTTIRGNNLTSNDIGIQIEDGTHVIYNNNFGANTGGDAKTFFSTSTWDNGVEGNYWPDYVFGSGVDVADGGDGIGDTPHVIDASNQDNYPLIGPIRFFNAGTWDEATYYVHTISNTTVSGFSFSEGERLISFNVTRFDELRPDGFCRVGIPKELLYSPNSGDWIVRVNGTSVPFRVQENDHAYIYFTYSHPIMYTPKNVQIFGTEVIPEFQSWASISVIFVILTAAIIVYKQKLLKTQIQ
jgi:hypothetical protein